MTSNRNAYMAAYQRRYRAELTAAAHRLGMSVADYHAQYGTSVHTARDILATAPPLCPAHPEWLPGLVYSTPRCPHCREELRRQAAEARRQAAEARRQAAEALLPPRRRPDRSHVVTLDPRPHEWTDGLVVAACACGWRAVRDDLEDALSAKQRHRAAWGLRTKRPRSHPAATVRP